MPRVRDELLTVAELLSELGIARATFYRWRQLGRGPEAVKLPNGELRFRRAALERWLDGLTEPAA